MPDYCCVPMCQNQGQPYSYHQFPKQEPFRKQWLHAVRRQDLRNENVTRNIKVCSNHFAVEDFVITETGERRRLKEKAVPSIFAWSGAATFEITPKARRYRSREAAIIPCVVVKADQHEVAAFEDVEASTDESSSEVLVTQNVGTQRRQYGVLHIKNIMTREGILRWKIWSEKEESSENTYKKQVPLTQELVTESPKELKHSPEMDASPHPFCSVTVKGEPDEIDMDLPFKTSLKTEEVDVKETVIEELVPEFAEDVKYSPPVDLSAEPFCSVTVKCEPEETVADLSFKTSPKVEVDDSKETVIEELVPEFAEDVKYSPPVDLSAEPFCSVTVKCEPEETVADLSFETSPKVEVEDLKVEMPDDDIAGNSSSETSPYCASYSLPSSSGGVGEQPTIRNVSTSKDEGIASSFLIFCPRCRRMFKDKCQLSRHLLQSCISKDGKIIVPHFCSQCSEVFENKCELRSHLYSDHKIKSEEVAYSCSVCNKIYVKRTDFMKHILEPHPRVNKHICPVCRETFHSCWDLHEHLAKYIDEYSYSCPNCDLKFPTRTSLELHMQMEEYTCKTCSLKFYNHSALNQHVQSHTEEILTCHICYKSYSKRLAFAQHISTHSSDIQLNCPMCLKKFASSSSLINHLRVHKSQHPFTCEICNKAFLQRSRLVGHMATHSAVQSFTCFVCRKSFTSLYDLERHEVIHREGKTWTLRRPTT